MENGDQNRSGGSPPADGTRIDLGEDLLENTRAGAGTSASTSTATSTYTSGLGNKSAKPDATLSVEEELANGEILLNEALFDEAKKVFRRVLRAEPGNIRARKLLEQVQEKEIQDLLSTENRVVKALGSTQSEEDETQSAVVQSLEKDLRLNLDRSDVQAVPDLFPDKIAESAYIRQIVQATQSLSPKDVMDLGIAHFEMGLFQAAKQIFEELIRHHEYKVSGMYLLGLSLIYGGECIEATIRLEPMIRDLTLPEDQKVDFLYMMAMAFERLGESIKAKDFYRRVYLLNPRYRDVQEKLR